MEYCIDCGAEMNYIGHREWECTRCHTIYEIEGIDYENENDCDDALSVYDAAVIWASHGKDEDYTFGFSESDLEEAL